MEDTLKNAVGTLRRGALSTQTHTYIMSTGSQEQMSACKSTFCVMTRNGVNALRFGRSLFFVILVEEIILFAAVTFSELVPA